MLGSPGVPVQALTRGCFAEEWFTYHVADIPAVDPVVVSRDRPHPRLDPPHPGELPEDLFDPIFATEELRAKDAVHLAAVIDGCKPGAAFVITGGGAEPVADALDDARLPHRLITKRPGSVIPSQTLAVAGTTDAYATMPPYERYGHIAGDVMDDRHNRDNCLFLGIPEPDMNWLSEDEYDEGKPLLENYSVEPPEDDHLLHLVSYIARPTEEGLERAVETARAYRDACRRVGEALGDDRVVEAPERAVEVAESDTMGLYHP